jgi:tetratricopeptide (TPR) repeat protein
LIRRWGSYDVQNSRDAISNFPEKLGTFAYEGDYRTAWAMQLLDEGRPQAAREQLVLAEGTYADHFHLSKPHYNLGLLYLRFSELSKTQAHFNASLKLNQKGPGRTV